MSATHRNDELPPAIVAAIIAALAAVSSDDSDENQPPVRNWPASARVVPRWRETGPTAWRDRERSRGWRA